MIADWYLNRAGLLCSDMAFVAQKVAAAGGEV